jgi:hypothetical protein
MVDHPRFQTITRNPDTCYRLAEDDDVLPASESVSQQRTRTTHAATLTERLHAIMAWLTIWITHRQTPMLRPRSMRTCRACRACRTLNFVSVGSSEATLPGTLWKPATSTWHSRDLPPRTGDVCRYPDGRPAITSHRAAASHLLLIRS